MPVPLETQRSFYLTLSSMIPSLAFGYLLTTVSLADPSVLAYKLMVLSTFVVIVLVWHEYAIGTMLYAWLIDFWDSVIPFLFGITQFLLIHALKPDAWSPNLWFFSLASFAAVSLCAFWNQFRKASKHPENQEVLSLLGRGRLRTLIYAGLSAILFSFEGLVAQSKWRNEWSLLGLSVAATIVLCIFALRGVVLYPKLMREVNAARKANSGTA